MSECECRSPPLSTQQPHEKKEFACLRARHKEERSFVLPVRPVCQREPGWREVWRALVSQFLSRL